MTGTQRLAALGAAAILGALAGATLPPENAWADGNVVAFVQNGTLNVQGDAQSNDVLVTQGDGVGQFVVTGRQSTLVNGTDSFVAEGVFTMVFRMDAGADVVELRNVTVRRDLRVRLDDGNDTCILDSVLVGRRTRIVGGDGADLVRVVGASDLQGTLRVRAGRGNDTVELVDLTARNRVRIDTQANEDTLLVREGRYESLARFIVRTGLGDDSVELDDARFDNDVFVNLGPGRDELRVEDNNFDKELKADGGSGTDTLDLSSGNSFKRRPRFRSFESLD